MLIRPEQKLPEHVAIIMDGNGRWAKKKGLARIEGHRIGMSKIREIADICSELGIRILTLYAFSRQNWNRPRREVNFLMKQFKAYLVREEKDLMKKKTQLRVIGRRDRLPLSLVKKIEEVMTHTRPNRKFILNLAIDYGGQEEIVDAVRSLFSQVKQGELGPEKIDVALFKNYLYMADLPYPDLLIRTGGDFRVSNFLLWYIAYTELWMTTTFWPDFGKEDFLRALRDYANRERRFGGISQE